jgi:hypothetical protein
MSSAKLHAEWLQLTPVSGPFLSIPVLTRAMPAGVDVHAPEHFRSLKSALIEWELGRKDSAIHSAWIQFVLRETLGYSDEVLRHGQSLPPGLEARIAEHGETLRPDFALVNPAGTPDAGKPRLLITVCPPTQNLDSPLAGQRWKASPATRMMELLHGSRVPLGIVTNGEHWMLVHAPVGETSAFASWFSSVWTEEKLTLQAFRTLLGAARFFGSAPQDRLEALFAESVKDQQEVTDQLGYQVRHAVEELVAAFDRLDKDSQRELLKDTSPKEVYNAALAIMMRLVFLFCAEERRLLLLGDEIYDDNYAVSTLREQLQEAADTHGEDVLERQSDAWTRLLATFRAVFGGIQHDRLRLPAYGGGLFDPDRYPFLEGRAAGTRWRDNSHCDPPAIDNRTVLHLLTSLQMLQIKVPGIKERTPQRLSFRALDIEQIGHVYEGLLDHTARKAESPILGLAGSKDNEPEIPLATLEAKAAAGRETLIEFLADSTSRSPKALAKDLESAAADSKTLHAATIPQPLLIACDNDAALAARIRPFAALLRDDFRAAPVVINVGSIYVTRGSDRRSTGTHYTPRSLTEPIVQHTLDPLVYVGPAEGLPPEQWKLKSARQILELKVCDMAMGSGAFLVQACRYLADKLVQAWSDAELAAGPGRIVVTPDGELSTGNPSEALVPREPVARLAAARRYIADRCLYGVDLNPMAVEMAKLSLWLTTLDKGRPFTFLDHALKCGDSLVGIHSLTQLETFSLDGKSEVIDTLLRPIRNKIAVARKLRRELEALPSHTPQDIEAKAAKNAAADEQIARLCFAADWLLAGEWLNMALGREERDEARTQALIDASLSFADEPLPTLRLEASTRLFQAGVKSRFHWPLEFPEVFDPSVGGGVGFDAFVGNPPFMAGSKITGAFSTEFREHLVKNVAGGRKGNADLCAYFFLRIIALMKRTAVAGIVATNTIAQGDTRELGLDAITTAHDFSIIRAVSTRKWPGTASVEVSHVWLRPGMWNGVFVLDDREVVGITSYLDTAGEINKRPRILAANVNISFSGNKVYGEGFVMSPDAAQSLIAHDARNAQVLFPYAKAEHINDRPDQTPGAWVINFGNRSVEEAKCFPDCYNIVLHLVKPHRDQVNRAHTRNQWWLHEHDRPDLYKAIQRMERVLFHGFTCKHLCFSFLPTNIVFAAPHAVIALDGSDAFAILQSTFHEVWVRKHGSTLRTQTSGMRYPASDVFETFPFPSQSGRLLDIGEEYYCFRSTAMRSLGVGVTEIYNRFHDRDEQSKNITRLRALHLEMDQAVATGYGWGGLDLGHGFHDTKQGVRYTLSEAARRTVLDRLLALNHHRYAEEVADGLHDDGKAKKKAGAKHRKSAATAEDSTLFEEPA